MITLKILNTTNYGKFKKIRGNRVINRSYLTSLAESVQENNLLPQNPIMVNDHLQILDGQHRLKVAETLGFPIYYVVVKAGGLKEVQMLNMNVRQWTTFDFLESYISLGKKEYENLKNFAENNDISISNAMYILNGGFQSHPYRNELIRDFRNGDFKATQQIYANAFIKKLDDVSKYTEDGVWKDREFLKALERAYFIVNHETLMEHLKRSNASLGRRSNIKDYIRDLEDVISFKKRSIKRITKK